MTPDHETPETAEVTEEETAPEMCCDGEKTAEAHRHEAPDGKCCIDK
jgi:hypothetical protein